MGIGMPDVHEGEEHFLFSQFLYHRIVCVEDKFTGEELYVLGKPAVFVDGSVIVEAVFKADIVIFLAVSRRYVDGAGPCDQGDEGRKD
jgi:hypothetical protein